MTVPPLTRTLTAIDRQMPVHCIAINDHIPPGTIAIAAHWDDILPYLLDNVRNATLDTRFELDHFPSTAEAHGGHRGCGKYSP